MVNSFANYPSLQGKNILIIGGASGIGKELVKGFAEQGANVAFLDLNDEAGERLSLNTGENVFFQNISLKLIVFKSTFMHNHIFKRILFICDYFYLLLL